MYAIPNKNLYMAYCQRQLFKEKQKKKKIMWEAYKLTVNKININVVVLIKWAFLLSAPPL